MCLIDVLLSLFNIFYFVALPFFITFVLQVKEDNGRQHTYNITYLRIAAAENAAGNGA